MATFRSVLFYDDRNLPQATVDVSFLDPYALATSMGSLSKLGKARCTQPIGCTHTNVRPPLVLRSLYTITKSSLSCVARPTARVYECNTLDFLFSGPSLKRSMIRLTLYTLVLSGFVSASPAQDPLSLNSTKKFYDVQAHRGGRGNTVESILPSFAWGLVDGATTLELDNGITLDGEVVVWHDEEITARKCRDTKPVVPNDPSFPYVGKFIANLTLAQIKTLDCGSQRQAEYPQQLLYPGAQIPTLKEVFDFVECADPTHQILWNIESKIDARFPNRTAGVRDFVQKQHAVFQSSPYYLSITVRYFYVEFKYLLKSRLQYQSFDWRTLTAMKVRESSVYNDTSQIRSHLQELDPRITTSALIDEDTAFMPDNSTTPWLAGLRLDEFPGPSFGEQVVQAAHKIDADILSPTATVTIPSPKDPSENIPFTTQSLINEAHRLGMQVKPWTVNRLDIADELLQWGVDGIITDYPSVIRRWAKQHGRSVAPKYPKQRIFTCLRKHMQLDSGN
ncbi:PLC-like phosphodiesterase [Scleroderma yunnanense]